MLCYTCAYEEASLFCVCVCFAGYMLSLISADLLIQPLNYSVVFLKKNILFWQMTFGSLRYILMRVRMKRYFQRLRKIYLQSRTERGNANHFWNKINILLKPWSRPGTFKQVLPKLNRRRSPIEFGGDVLKTLFETAIVSDVYELHKVFNELQSSQTTFSHSISKQVTYM